MHIYFLVAARRCSLIACIALAVVLALSGCATPSQDASHQSAPSEPKPTPSVIAARATLANEFVAFLQKLYPSYNDIFVSKMGFDSEDWAELEARHAFLGQTAFAAGPEAAAIKTWAYSHSARLIEARFNAVSVGAQYLGSYNDKTYFIQDLRRANSRPE